jgi:glycerate 2-kinase
MHPRRLLLECYDAALRAVDGRECVRSSLASRPPPPGAWHVVAVGKAAGAMALGAAEALGDRVVAGLAVVPHGRQPDGLAPGRWQVFESSHPVPDAASVRAGAQLVERLETWPDRAQVLFLVSGGASSLVEHPVNGVTLDDLREFNQWALASGRPIGEINALRRRLSALKGGGLARQLRGRRALALMISDVPGDDPSVIGSGLLHARRTSVAALPWVADLPEPISQLLARADSARAAGDATTGSAAPRVPVRVVATLRHACRAAAAAAEARGCAAVIAPRRYAGDAARLGTRFARTAATGPLRTLHVWAGEATVRLPTHPGRGGRNQHLALSAARWLARADARDVCLLAAGTDGIDGSSEDAGAIVDAGTCRRAREGGQDDALASLVATDSGSFLAAAGDLLHTGATSTNVGDVVLAVRMGGVE